MATSEHDYTSQGWGHAIGMMDGDRWMGHGPAGRPRMRSGDVILVRMQSGRRGRYAIERIEYFRDPPDMWKASVRFDGYAEPSDG